MNTASGPEARLVGLATLFALTLALAGACGDDSSMMIPDAGPLACVQDLSLDPSSAEPLAAGVETMGYVCPEVDEDWFSFTIPAAEPLLRVELAIDNARSPVEATYSVSPAGSPEMAVAIPNGEDVEPGADFSDVHCIGAGDYNIVVRDQSSDGEDIRNPYALRLTTLPEPDGLEPNDDLGAARPIGMGAPMSGFISCIGDVDFFTFDVGARDAVRVTLEAEELGYQPQLTILDAAGETVIQRDSPRGAFEATAITFERQLDAGTYYVRISDDDDTAGNAAVPYTLLLGVFEDPDTNEPNDGPLEATDLGTLSCGGAWSSYLTNAGGAIVTAADTDWFEVDLTGCRGGVIEAEAVIDTSGLSDADAWDLQRQVQMSVSIVRDAPGSACDEDIDCNVLPTTCEENIDCAGLLEACQPDGRCAGARVCLPSAVCGANQTFRSYRETSIPDPVTGPPPPNRAIVAAPILATGHVWIRVADFQSDGGDPRARYTLRVRVRSDPDAFEPDNLYLNDPLMVVPADPIPQPLTIHDCTAGDCCTGTFDTVHISYDGDHDYLAGTHPCPGANCMLRMHYQVGAGDVRPLIRLKTSAGRWFEANLDPGTSGTIGDVGRPTGAAECIVADQRHDMTPFDIEVFHFEDAPENLAWDADQSVRICLEITSNTCVAPCIERGGNCEQR